MQEQSYGHCKFYSIAQVSLQRFLFQSRGDELELARIKIISIPNTDDSCSERHIPDCYERKYELDGEGSRPYTPAAGRGLRSSDLPAEKESFIL